MQESVHTEMPDRIVVIGDLHGHYQGLLCILHHACLIDDNLNWIGGDSWLIQMGDIFGRGSQAIHCCQLLIKLQDQASATGGVVHCLLGNHEAMVTHRQLQYIPPAEFEHFADQGPEIQPAQAFVHAICADQPIGRWLRDLPVAIKIGSVVFIHAGLDPRWTSRSLDRINLQANTDMHQDCPYGELPANSPILASRGPLWNRRLALADDWNYSDLLQPVLQDLEAHCLVIGHTPTSYMAGYEPGTIVTKFDGALICTDVGISPHYGGYVSWLEIVEGRPYACWPNRHQPLAANRQIRAEQLVH